MVIEKLKEANINAFEYCYVVEPAPKLRSSSSFKIRIPKLMPLIYNAPAKDYTTTIGDSILVNDKACKPVINKTLSMANYLIGNIFNNPLWMSPYKGVPKDVDNDKVSFGTQMICIFINNNITDFLLLK